MPKLFIASLVVLFSSLSFAAQCTYQEAVKPFKASLEKDYFGGKNIDFRLLVNGPHVKSGKYFFVANNAKWSGSVILDLENCTMVTDGSWVAWRTIDESGNY